MAKDLEMTDVAKSKTDQKDDKAATTDAPAAPSVPKLSRAEVLATG